MKTGTTRDVPDITVTTPDDPDDPSDHTPSVPHGMSVVSLFPLDPAIKQWYEPSTQQLFCMKPNTARSHVHKSVHVEKRNGRSL